jgi:hypothetical protein
LAISLLAAAPAEHVRPVASNTRSRISLAIDKCVFWGELQPLPWFTLQRTHDVTSKYASSSETDSKSGSYILKTCTRALCAPRHATGIARPQLAEPLAQLLRLLCTWVVKGLRVFVMVKGGTAAVVWENIKRQYCEQQYDG